MKHITPRRFAAFAALAFALPATAQIVAPARAASMNPNGTTGLSQVISAEGLGESMVNISVHGSLYPQQRAYAGSPPEDAQITVATGAVALGLNRYLDAFTGFSVFNMRNDDSRSGWGSSFLGAKFNVPFAREQRIRLAGQLVGNFGTANTPPQNFGIDGYSYYETRQETDVMVTLAQSILLTQNPKETGFKIHFNEGIVSSFEPGTGVQLLTGAGVEFIPIVSFIAGLELNSRTFLEDPSLKDPFWVTPSVTWRTPAYINVNLGVDLALSGDRNDAGDTRALEPWRVFGGLTYAVDTRKDNREAAAQRRREAAAERQRMIRERDSLAVVAAANRAKAVNDSIALYETRKRLQEELARRPELQKQLLTEGLLVLDAVYFETGKTQISINSEPYLDLIARLLVQYPKLQIEVGGHTDNVGGLEYNQNLSQGRSQAVVDYMTRVEPELRGRLVAKGYAYSQPKATNETAEGRQLNRRTELKVLNREALREYQ
jgi:outer membrane protein OmpA-like peptidoglycan-associated protein